MSEVPVPRKQRAPNPAELKIDAASICQQLHDFWSNDDGTPTVEFLVILSTKGTRDMAYASTMPSREKLLKILDEVRSQSRQITNLREKGIVGGG